MNRILVVDDDLDLCELLAKYLRREGLEVDLVHDGNQGVERALSGDYTLVVLDVMLPGLNGFDALSSIRSKSSLPVLMLTARGDDVDRIVGLEMGADDYLPKPFNPRELIARIRAILRRARVETDESPLQSSPERFSVGDVELDKGTRMVTRGKAGADNYLSLLESAKRTRAYLFDENGSEVTGRAAPPDVREMALSLVAGEESKFIQTARTDYAAKRINAPGGSAFIIVGERPRPTGIPLPFWPRVWWAQLLAVLLTAGILCYGLARYFSSPVVKLRAATQQLAAGDLSARVGAAKGKRRDELADLGRDFDIMAERIETLMASQRRLLHDISHELRSPLARLKIALELARQDDKEEARWALDRIEREADRLNDLIGQLLTLARLESDSPVTGADRVDLKRLVEEVAIDADFEARSNNRAVNVVTSQDCLIVGNEQLLHSAIENVVRNAVRYTDEGTEVEVSLRCEGNSEHPQAVIRVLDQGAGVPQAALANIFRPFYRVADARDRQSGGIGLGLSISQRAVEIHGGAIKASNAAGGGLLVEILLPLEPAIA